MMNANPKISTQNDYLNKKPNEFECNNSSLAQQFESNEIRWERATT